MPSRWPAGIGMLTAVALLAALALLLPPLLAVGSGLLLVAIGHRQRPWLTRRLVPGSPAEPLTLSVGPEGLRLAIGAESPLPLRDAWRIGAIDVLYPAAGAPQLLWPDSLLPADRARMRALMTLHPCSSR
jgi:hypothetical protein